MWIAEVQTHVRRYHPVAINVFWLVLTLNSNTFYSNLFFDQSCISVLCVSLSCEFYRSVCYSLLLDRLLYSWDMSRAPMC
ncbi:hypothetical protein COCSADRAFT_229242 [Bipolaris sorokiniana ND90Pr]|uniref:Uncharacterized protein n=1 Tax=Cochliobolus sativus (strain ND90Pr / ATCC 201652) TaxID=665912 RepID=M2R4Y3_COCSN|nr:uncharacterized protein COCSADRAFT_229242 [Bipolaris sorokiniana ND90Pr]EMD62219.1 hypothetical protein COCSADRAFT_229242 [Bipolaris sorokiniana ND90Pr]